MVSPWLYLTLPIVVGALLWGWWRRRRILMFLNMPSDTFWKILIPIVAVILLLIVLHEPSIERTQTITQYKGADVVFVVDVSLSMDARDGSQKSRLQRAKEFLAESSKRFTDERTGLVIFAKRSFAWLPFLTTDKALFNYFVGQLSTDIMSARGTDLATAVLRAAQILKDSDNRTIVLLTDGEIQGEDVEDVAVAVEVIRKMDIKLLVVPIGSTGGSLIPIGENEFLKNEEGELVQTRLRLDILRTLTQLTSGEMVDVDQPVSIHQASRERVGERQVTQNVPLFQWLLVMALVLTCCNFLVRR